MYNVSTEFRRNLYNDNRNYLLYADVVLADGTKLPLQNAQIWNNGYKIEDAVSGDNSFDIGSVIINKFTLVINNIYDEYSEYDFTGATVTARIGMEVSTGTEKIRRGVYTVDEPTYNGSSITLECLDNLQNLDKPYSLSKLQFPATIRTIMQDACSCCGIQMATAAFDNDSFIVDIRPDDESLTFRQVVFWCMQIACKWAKADEWGRLKVGWYDDVAYEGMRSLDGGSFDNGTPSYQSGDSFDGGTFADYNSGDSFDGGTFADQKKYHHIYSTSSTNLCTDDVVITGVRVICEEEQEVTDESGNTSTQKVDVVYQSGTDGYVLTVSGNKLIQNGKGNDVAVYLGQKLIGWRFRPFNLSCLSDPSIEAGDICIISDRKGNTYKSLITNTTFQPGSYQAVSCGAETPLRNSATRFSEATQVYQELRKNLNRTKTEWEKAMKNLSDRLENSGGLYTTIEKQEDGSSVFYMHDKPLMTDSLILWKMTRDAWGVSTDGGKSWNGGMTVDGEMITKILNTIGLNADWINTGAFVVKDAHGNVMFLADTATGRVVIVADEFMLRGKTIEELSQEANEAILDALAQDIQTQLDGKIETYNQTSDPSTAWTTTAAKQAHTGDLWYSSSTKLTKRWTGTAWSPLTMEDTAAQELAKSKKRVFISTPVPPYDVGDLWVGNSASDMKRCQTTRSSGSYVSSDWIKAVKYTDDTVAWNAYYEAQDAMNASTNPAQYLTQTAIFNKLTNNGALQGLYMSGGQLYINFSYGKGGTLLLGGAGNTLGTLRVLNSYGTDFFTLDKNGMELTRTENAGAPPSFRIVCGEVPVMRSAFGYGSIEMTDQNGRLHEIYPQHMASEGYWRFCVSTPTEVCIEVANIDRLLVKSGGTEVKGSFSCTGTKKRIIDAKNYGTVSQYCYEMASPAFGDIGEGETDDDGVCVIFLDAIFEETVNTGIEYQVFLQKERQGDLWVEKKNSAYFIVKGSSNLKFAWEVKVKQRDYEYERMEIYDKEEKQFRDIAYEEEAAEMATNYITEMEDINNEEINELYQTDNR